MQRKNSKIFYFLIMYVKYLNRYEISVPRSEKSHFSSNSTRCVCCVLCMYVAWSYWFMYIIWFSIYTIHILKSFRYAPFLFCRFHSHFLLLCSLLLWRYIQSDENEQFHLTSLNNIWIWKWRKHRTYINILPTIIWNTAKLW